VTRRGHKLLLLLGVLVPLFVAGACAAADEPFGGAAPVSADTLETERAGYFSADGQEFSFSATLTTLVNGQVALVTTLNLQDNGSVSVQTVVNTEVLKDADLPKNSGAVVIPVDSAASLAAALSGTNVDLNGLSATGLVVKSNSGVTAILDNVGGNQLQNLVINTANGQNIVQNTSITLTLPAGRLAGAQASQLMNSLDQALSFAQLSGGIH
jgi:hypothetical protein